MTNNPTIDGVCKTCLGSGKEYDGAAHTCTECNGLGGAPAVERQEPNPSQVPVLRAMAANYRNGHSWDFLDGEAVSKAADEITAQVSTIARLEARVAELESERGEIAGFRYRANGEWELMEESPFADGRTHYKLGGEELQPLYTASPAPVAVVLPERRSHYPGTDAEWYQAQGWNACLDATAALNGDKP